MRLILEILRYLLCGKGAPGGGNSWFWLDFYWISPCWVHPLYYKKTCWYSYVILSCISSHPAGVTLLTERKMLTLPMILRDWYCMKTSSKGNIFRTTRHFWGESTGQRRIPVDSVSTVRSGVHQINRKSSTLLAICGANPQVIGVDSFHKMPVTKGIHTGGRCIPSQRASDVKNVSMPWRDNGVIIAGNKGSICTEN